MNNHGLPKTIKTAKDISKADRKRASRYEARAELFDTYASELEPIETSINSATHEGVLDAISRGFSSAPYGECVAELVTRRKYALGLRK